MSYKRTYEEFLLAEAERTINSATWEELAEFAFGSEEESKEMYREYLKQIGELKC